MSGLTKALEQARTAPHAVTNAEAAPANRGIERTLPLATFGRAGPSRENSGSASNAIAERARALHCVSDRHARHGMGHEACKLKILAAKIARK